MNTALVSIHDVMPSTLMETRELMDLCAQVGVSKVTLLVVPGLVWNSTGLDQIKRWRDDGHEIAAHGWVHQCERISSWYHRGHSLLLSRDVAEHLSRSESDVFGLMQRTAHWFHASIGVVPELYVPPAWALGRISWRRIRETPYRWVETLTGLVDVRSGRQQGLPLLGFEADTFLRQHFLGFSNTLNAAWSRLRGRVLRVAIHPYDHRLKLARRLTTALQAIDRSMLYREISI